MRALVYAVALAAIALLPLAFPWLAFLFVLAIAMGFAALGVALLLRAGLISIGHAMFYGLGAYATAFLTRIGVTDLGLLLVLSAASSALAGVVVGAFMVRYRAIFFAMLNLAVSMVFFTLLSKLYAWTGGSDGLRVGAPTLLGQPVSRATIEAILLYGGLVLLVGASLLVHRYLQSSMGQALSAVHTNEVRLAYLGVSVRGVLLSAYALSAVLAGIGGFLAAVAIGHVLPEMTYWTVSGQLVLVAVLGGAGTVVGPFIGAFFLEGVRSLAAGYLAESWNLVIGVALLLVIFFLPGGLHGLLHGGWRRRPA